MKPAVARARAPVRRFAAFESLGFGFSLPLLLLAVLALLLLEVEEEGTMEAYVRS